MIHAKPVNEFLVERSLQLTHPLFVRPGLGVHVLVQSSALVPTAGLPSLLSPLAFQSICQWPSLSYDVLCTYRRVPISQTLAFH